MTHKSKIKELVGRGLDSYHTKALQQMDRIEKKNKEQNHKINILTNELDNDYLTKTEEGSVISLEHSKEGMIYLDELQGNTLVNYCPDGAKELTLNGDVDVEGTNVTLTEGVDGGLVDVICEGNTLVNLNKRFYSVQTPSWDATNSDYVVSAEGHTVAGGVLWYYTYLKPSTTYTMVVNILECTNMRDISLDSHYSYPPADTIAFKKEVGVQKIVFNTKDSFEQVRTSIKIATYGNDTTNKLKISKQMILLEGDWTNKEIPTEYFEGMKSVGEYEDNKIEILSTNSDNTLSNKKEITLSEPLRGLQNGVCDKFVKQGGKWYVERNCGIREYQEGDLELSNTLTDTKNTVYQLATPAYEEITDSQVITYLDTTHISNNSTIPCNMKIQNSGYYAIIKPSTQYTVAFDTNTSGTIGINLGGSKVTTTNNVATVTTPSTLTDDTLRLTGKGIKASKVRLLEGDKTNYIPSYFEGMKSCFEDKLQDDGTYKIEITSTNTDNTLSNKIQFSSIEPLRGVGDVKDRFVFKDGKLMIERSCSIREYQEGDYELSNVLTDEVNTVYILDIKIYEEIPFELQKIILEGYENGTLFLDTNIPPTSTVTYAGETPIVKSVKLNKTEVLNNTNDINDNIVPYLMDMDYRVVCLQLEGGIENISMTRLFGGTYEMLQRDILSKRYSKEEYKYRLDAYLSANKITENEYEKLGDMLNE